MTAKFQVASPLLPICSCNQDNGLTLTHIPAHTTHLRCLLKHFVSNGFNCPTCLQTISPREFFSNREILAGILSEGVKATAENAQQAVKALLFGAAIYALISFGKNIL